MRRNLSWSVVLYGAGLLALVAAIALSLRYRGPLETAFHEAPRDSFGTDVTEDVARALPLGTHAPQAVQYVEENGFMCHRSELAGDRQLWTCQRRAFRLGRIGYERWTLEFECDRRLAPCTMIKHRAAVR
ncbi:MAG TPA: hypothetical protein VF744_05425 [Beijerinckiaceae bacterium]